MYTAKASFARRVATASLGLALGLAGPLGAALPALAAPEQGQITITANQGNAVTYDAYQIFKADLLASGKAQHIEWASNDMKAAVEGAIRAVDADYAGTTAQDALEFINANWGESSATRIVGADDFPNKLADAIDALQASGTVTPGTAATFDEGFYLFLTTPSTLDADNEMGTSPIFTAINKDSAVTITEKTTLPTVQKQVKEDSGTRAAIEDSYVAATADDIAANGDTKVGLYKADGGDYVAITQEDVDANPDIEAFVLVPGQAASDGWGNHADANRSQDVDFKLIGTVASNVATFDTYFYEFEDTLSAGLDMQTSSVAVTVDGIDVTSQVSDGISFAGGKLKVTINDLKALTNEGQPIPITANTKVVVTYKAHLDGDAVIGATGNPNDVFINYSNNPNTTSKGHTNTVQVKTYTYQLEMVKVDKDNINEKLSGAKITIQVASSNSDASSVGKYVQADGSLADTPYEFTTNTNGVISVAGLDEGTYTLHETTPPTDYAAWDADITLTITSQFNATTGAFETIAATMSGGEGDSETKVTATDAATGKVSIQATDDKELDTPLTGASGIALITATGVGIIGLSLAGLYKGRKQEEDETV